MKEIYASEILGIPYEEGNEICKKINAICKRDEILTVMDLIEAARKELEQREFELLLLLTGVAIGIGEFGIQCVGGEGEHRGANGN